MKHLRSCIRVLLLATIVFTSTGVAAAQIGSTVFTFQQIITDPHSLALGESTVALRGYAGAASINPASIGRTGTVLLSTNVAPAADGGLAAMVQTPWMPGFSGNAWVSSQNAAVKVGRWAAAYQYKHMDLGERVIRTAQNGPLATYQPYDYSHKFTLAYDVRPNLSVGAGVNFIRSEGMPSGSEAEPRSLSGRSFDLGLLYDRKFVVPHARIKMAAGWSLTDFGPHVGRDPLSTRMRGGLSVSAASDRQWIGRPLVTAGLHGALAKKIVQVDYDDEGRTASPHGPFRALFTTWRPLPLRATFDTADPVTLSVVDQLVRHAGLSASLLDILHLRLGSYHEHQYNGARQYATVGWGVDLYYLALDHSTIKGIEQNHPLEDTTFWRLTGRVPLGANEDNFWPALLRRLR